MLEEACGELTFARWGAALDAPHTAASHARLVELAELLGMPQPPPAELLAGGGDDRWAREAGLLHQGCRGDRGEHWAHQCRG